VAVLAKRDRRSLEEDEVQRDLVGDRDVLVIVAVAVGAVSDGRRAELGLIELGQHRGDLGDDGAVGRPGEDHRRARAGRHRIVEVGIGEEQHSELGQADDEAEQGRGDQSELDGAGAVLVAAKLTDHAHCTLTAPVAVICLDFMKKKPLNVLTIWRWT
jgi:hypothetical protein